MGGFADRLAARRCETGSDSPVCLMTLSMTDIEDNALMVNAIQRRATVVVQKSLEEGFGLTVAESMRKSRPVVASAVGGHCPTGGAGHPKSTGRWSVRGGLGWTAGTPRRHGRNGTTGPPTIRSHCLSDRHLLAYADLLKHVARL